MVNYDRCCAGVQHANTKHWRCDTNQSHCLALPNAFLQFFIQTCIIIKAVAAKSIRPSSSAVKPFIKTSNTQGLVDVRPVITFANQLSHRVIDWMWVRGSRILCFFGGSEGQCACSGFPFGFLSILSRLCSVNMARINSGGIGFMFLCFSAGRGIDCMAVITNYIFVSDHASVHKS